MKQHKSKIAMAIIAMLISSHASAQVSDQQIKDFFASNPTPEQIAAAAANLGMNANQISAAMGVANYGGSQAARDAAINSWVGNQANGYAWNAQGQVVKGAAPSLPDPVGVNQASLEKGVWSPVERRWITNDELRAFGATNPSQEQMMQQAIKQGLNPQSIDYAAYVISGAKDWRDQKYGELVNKLNNSMYTGQYGYGYAEDYSQGAALVKGNGAVHYKMPDGSEVSVRMHNGIPDQSYAEVLAQYNAVRLQSGAGSSASVPIPVPQAYAQQGWPQSNQNSATANANSQQGAPQIDPSVAMAAASSVVGSSKNQICPTGMTVTMTHSGIRKCVGTMIREKPLQITPPKVGSQQSTAQTQQPIYIHPPLPPVRVETIQAHEYVGGQNGASASNQGFLESEGTGGLEPNPGYRMQGMFQMPKGYIRAESDWPGATFLEGIGWIAPNGKDLPVATTGGVTPNPWVQPETGGVYPKPEWQMPVVMPTLPTGWSSYTPAQKIAFFNQKNVTESNLRGIGVADADIAWMKQNGFGNAGTGGGSPYEPGRPATGGIPNGYISVPPGTPGAMLVEGIGYIMPNGKGPAIIDSQSGTGGGYYIGPSGMKQPLNLGGNGPAMGAGGPNPGFGQNGNLVFNGPGLGAGGPNGPVFPGLGIGAETGRWVKPEQGGDSSGRLIYEPVQPPGTGGLERNPTYGQMPNGYIKAEPNWPGARLVEGIGWIAPNGKAPALTTMPGTGGLEPNPNASNQWIIGGSGGMKPEAR